MYPQRSVMTCGLATALEPPHFNHAPVRGAIGAIQYVAGYVTKFQSTHPRGVRRAPGAFLRPSPNLFQSTHPRGVRPPKVTGKGQIYFVFQSTHPRGVRPAHFRALRTMPRFNPRTRVGCDVIQRTGAVFHALVSIHAPAWGATCCSCCPGQLVCCFNPRTRVGCDHSWVPLILTSSAFQSTHPRGVRHDLRAIEDLRHAVSIHAPAWGATSSALTIFASHKRFNPRTRVGCDIR